MLVGQKKVSTSNKSNFCHSIAEEAVDKKIPLVKLNSGQNVLERGTKPKVQTPSTIRQTITLSTAKIKYTILQQLTKKVNMYVCIVCIEFQCV